MAALDPRFVTLLFYSPRDSLSLLPKPHSDQSVDWAIRGPYIKFINYTTEYNLAVFIIRIPSGQIFSISNYPESQTAWRQWSWRLSVFKHRAFIYWLFFVHVYLYLNNVYEIAKCALKLIKLNLQTKLQTT